MRKKPILVSFIAFAAAGTLLASVAWLTGFGNPSRRSQATQTPGATSTKAGLQGPYANMPLTECQTIELPPEPVETDNSLDYESKILMISFWDPKISKNRQVYIRYEDSACQQNPRLKFIIDAELKLHAETRVGMCRLMRDIAVGAPPGGRREAAKRYLEQWCK